MDFVDALKVLWRRRLVVLLGILLTALGCAAVLTQVATVYQASAQYLLLLPPTANGEDEPQNPLINQPTGLVLGATLIAAEVNTKSTVREMDRAGFDSDFELALSPNNGPLLSLTVTGTDRTDVVDTRDEVIRRLDEQLADLQQTDIADIPSNQVITSVPVAVNQTAEAVPGAKIKALVVVVAVGGLVTLLLAFALDRPLSRRAARRAGGRGRDAGARDGHDGTLGGASRETVARPAPAEPRGR